MMDKKARVRQALLKATSASVQKEMAKPREARSARIAKRKLDPRHIAEEPSVQIPGTVEKIIPARRPGQPEKAKIAVAGASRRPQDLRIKNELIDEDGNDVKLKKGAHVQVTVSTGSEK